MASSDVYVLGGYQTDFARNWSREGLGIADMMGQAVGGALERTELAPDMVDTAHIGNFAAELFCGQGQLGGIFASLDPAFSGLPASRHEAACASGSIALLAAAAEIEAGRYDIACVVGVECMRNVPGDDAAGHLGAACWRGREAEGARFVWPHMFGRLMDTYAERYGLDYAHLMRIAEINYANASRNPDAQTRNWRFGDNAFRADDQENPVIEGPVRRQDCGQVSDGAAVVFLASRRAAEAHARRTGGGDGALSRIAGWGHRTATMRLQDKFAEADGRAHVFPHLRAAIEDAYRRAGVSSPEELDLIETHDCFTITEYMAIDHFGITAPGEAWRAVEDGTIAASGRLPVNPSGGLIGLGHPVGATGVRMLLDAHRQVTGDAGACQVAGARRAATLNIGGSATTSVCFVAEAVA